MADDILPPSGRPSLKKYGSSKSKSKGSKKKERRLKEDSRDESENERSRRGRSASRGRGRSRSSSRIREKTQNLSKKISRSLSRIRSNSNSSKNKNKSKGRHIEKQDSKTLLPPTGLPVQDKPKTYELPPTPKAPSKIARSIDEEVHRLLAERNLLSPETPEPEFEPEPEPEFEPNPQERDRIDVTTNNMGQNDVMKLDNNNTTLHVSCLLHHSTSEILQRLENEPEFARCRNDANESPLHYAAMDKQGVDKDVLRRLIQIHPEAVKQRNNQNSLPIHLTCMIGAPSVFLVKTLVKMYPKGVMIKSKFPLLFDENMAEKNKSKKTNEFQYASDSESEGSGIVINVPQPIPSAADSIKGMFACAAPHQAAIEIAYEKSKKRKERQRKARQLRSQESNREEGPKMETGFSPLHLAVMNNAPPTVIQLLVDTNPECIHLKTNRGRTALDCSQYIVRQTWLYGSDKSASVQNTYDAIEILETALLESNTDDDDSYYY